MIVSDAAKRAADIVNGYLAFVPWGEIQHKFVAIRLSDGGSDGNLYDSKRDAVRHQLHENLCAYVGFRNIMGGVSAYEMQKYLDFNRMAYDAGFRLADPDHRTGGPDLFMPVSQHDDFGAWHARNIILGN
jgi:hypothetical protein